MYALADPTTDYTLLPPFQPHADLLDGWHAMSTAERLEHLASRADRKLERAGLPRRVDREASWSFGAWERHIVDGATEWATAPALNTLVLDGPIGTGKTSLACLLARLVASRTDVRLVRYVQSGALMQSLGDHEAPADIREADLLIIDDLGRGHDGAFPSARSRLWVLLDYRWANALPVLYTTNLEGSVAEFKRMLGNEADALIDRMKDTRNCRLRVEAHGGSQRLLREVG